MGGAVGGTGFLGSTSRCDWCADCGSWLQQRPRPRASCAPDCTVRFISCFPSVPSFFPYHSGFGWSLSYCSISLLPPSGQAEPSAALPHARPCCSCTDWAARLNGTAPRLPSSPRGGRRPWGWYRRVQTVGCGSPRGSLSPSTRDTPHQSPLAQAGRPHIVFVTHPAKGGATATERPGGQAQKKIQPRKRGAAGATKKKQEKERVNANYIGYTQPTREDAPRARAHAGTTRRCLLQPPPTAPPPPRGGGGRQTRPARPPPHPTPPPQRRRCGGGGAAGPPQGCGR